MKTKPYKNAVRRREAPPKINKGKNGYELYCPFCKEPHLILPFLQSPCGTTVIFHAEQTVYRAQANPKMICAKCGKGGGEMVPWNGAYIHIHECNPGVKAALEEPKYSKLAAFVHGIKNEKVKNSIQKLTGRAIPVEEVTPDGKPTGKILGYFFNKIRGRNGKHSTSHT